jgi:hypothetical protein
MPLAMPRAFTHTRAAPTHEGNSLNPTPDQPHMIGPNAQIDAEKGMEQALETRHVDNLSRAEKTFDAEDDPSALGQLDYNVWLPFAAPVYKISPRIEDYVIVNTIICPSDIPNRNGIAFPATELARFQPPPMNRMAYKAWKGCPVHLEHDNEVHERAYGVILDASLQKVEGYGDGKLWKVMGLLAIDKNKNPEMARKVLTKQINTYSMGALVDYFTCGYCGTQCTSRSTCGHIESTKQVNWKAYRDFDGSTHLAFLNAHGIQPIECSIVADPAWAPALSDTVYDPWGSDPQIQKF